MATLEKELEEATSNLSHIKDDLLDSNSANKSLEADSAVINQVNPGMIKLTRDNS